MTGTGRAPVSLERAASALGDGGAVVLPNPAPLTHVVAARGAPTVNAAKGRPAGQPVALWAHHPGTVRDLDGVWDLAPDDRALARWLLAAEHLTVLVPVRTDTEVPAWTAPAVKDSWMLLFGARWEPLRPLLDRHPVLYVSSANRTGCSPVATTADALAAFPAEVAVLAPPATEAPATERRATTTVRLRRDGGLDLHRDGAQNHDHPDPADYLRRLRGRAREATG